jgi:hypothetical protein
MNDQQREHARDTLRCFNSMETTKRRHIELLTMLDNKKKRFNLDPTSAEKTLLAALLRDHDEEVAAFAAASSALKTRDPAAHTALFEYIGNLTAALSQAEGRVEH